MQKKILTWLWLFGFASLLCLEAHAQQAFAPGQIKAARITGSVTATKDGSTITVVNGTELVQGHVINTAKNSSVVLVFSNGATMNLAQDSSLSIDEFTQDPFADEVSVSQLTSEPSASQTRLYLNRGELVGNVKKLNYDAGSRFEVHTPVGAAGIRGTTFRILFRPDGTGKAVFSLITVEGNIVLLAGSANLPAETWVSDNQEVQMIVNVTEDTTTGKFFLTVDGAAPIVIKRDASAGDLADIRRILQQIAEAVAQMEASVIQTPPATDVVLVTNYTVVRGDSLWSLAKKHNLTVAELAAANRLSASAPLEQGQRLVIPGKSGALVAETGFVSSTLTETPPPPPPAETPTPRTTPGDGSS